jgi:spermidine/putrescine transport system permease protein
MNDATPHGPPIKFPPPLLFPGSRRILVQAFFHITLPIIGPTVVGAALIAMALSVDDFIITFFTIGGGNTLPTFMWGMLRKGMNPSINVVALTLMAITLGVTIASMRLIRYRG